MKKILTLTLALMAATGWCADKRFDQLNTTNVLTATDIFPIEAAGSQKNFQVPWSLMANTVGSAATNYANTIGLNGSNYSKIIGGYVTSYVNTGTANLTSLVNTVSGNLTSYVNTGTVNLTSLVNTVSGNLTSYVSSTSNSLAVGSWLTNATRGSPSVGTNVAAGQGLVWDAVNHVWTNGVVSASGNFIANTNGYGTNTILDVPILTNGVNYGAAFSSPGSAALSEQFGSLAQATNSAATAIGNSAIAWAVGSVALGQGAYAPNGVYGTALGAGASTTNDYATAVGNDSTASGINSIALGTGSKANYDFSVSILGPTTQTNQFMFGDTTFTYEFPGWSAVFGGSISATNMDLDSLDVGTLYATNAPGLWMTNATRGGPSVGTNVAAGQGLVWDDTNKLWTNGTVSPGGNFIANSNGVGTNITIYGLTVDSFTTSNLFVNNLYASNQFGVWTTNHAGGDVSVTNPTAAQYIGWDNTAKIWTNLTFSAAGNFIANTNGYGTNTILDRPSITNENVYGIATIQTNSVSYLYATNAPGLWMTNATKGGPNVGTPTNGQALVWDATANDWTNGTVSTSTAFIANTNGVGTNLTIYGTLTATNLAVNSFTATNLYVSTLFATNSNLILATNGYGTNTILDSPNLTNGVNRGNAFASLGSAADAEQFGLAAEASGQASTAVGNGATADSNGALALGQNASSLSGAYSTALGTTAKASNGLATAIGSSALAGGTNSVALGANSVAINNFSVGILGATTDTNQFMFGTNNFTYQFPGKLASFGGTTWVSRLIVTNAPQFLFTNSSEVWPTNVDANIFAKPFSIRSWGGGSAALILSNAFDFVTNDDTPQIVFKQGQLANDTYIINADNYTNWSVYGLELWQKEIANGPMLACFNTNGLIVGDAQHGTTNFQTLGSNAVVKGNLSTYSLTIGTPFTNAVLSSAASASNAPAHNEFPSAGWVRDLFAGSGAVWYNSTNLAPGLVYGSQPFVYVSGTIPAHFSRSYTNATNNQYVGAVAITNQTAFSGPITVSSYMCARGGVGATRGLSVKPEIYYSYNNGTNLSGDWDCQAQALALDVTNRYDFVISVPSTLTTGGVFTIYRVLKVTSATGATVPVLDVLGGTNTPSQLSISGPSSSAGNAFLANNQTFTGTNTFTKPISADTLNVGTIVLTNPINVSIGGTGRTNLTNGCVLIGNGTNPVTLLTSASGWLTNDGAGVIGWSPTGPPSSATNVALTNLIDTAFTYPQTNGDVLTFDGTSGKWTNKQPAAVGGLPSGGFNGWTIINHHGTPVWGNWLIYDEEFGMTTANWSQGGGYTFSAGGGAYSFGQTEGTLFSSMARLIVYGTNGVGATHYINQLYDVANSVYNLTSTNIDVEARLRYFVSNTNMSVQLGWLTSNTTSNQTEGIFWEFNAATDTNWVIKCIGSTTSNFTTTFSPPIGVSATANWFTLGMCGSSNSMVFYTNGAPVWTNGGSSSLNMTAVKFGTILSNCKTNSDAVGVANNLDIDYIKMFQY